MLGWMVPHSNTPTGLPVNPSERLLRASWCTAERGQSLGSGLLSLQLLASVAPSVHTFRDVLMISFVCLLCALFYHDEIHNTHQLNHSDKIYLIWSYKILHNEVLQNFWEIIPFLWFVTKQALRNSCELLRQRKELHTSSWNCMQAHGTSCKLIKFMKVQGTACKLRELHPSLCNCMQAYVSACKLM